MPKRSDSANPLITGKYYHLYNRGVAKQNIFTKPRHYKRFEKTAEYYRMPMKIKLSRFLNLTQKSKEMVLDDINVDNKSVKIIAYCLMPNHFHFLVQQTKNQGISEFMRLVCNSYTRYFNTTNNRVGPIFQGRFKAKIILDDDYLIRLSRYIHLNPYIANIVNRKSIINYPYSSLLNYAQAKGYPNISIDSSAIISLFGNHQKYMQYCLDTQDYQETITSISNITLDIDSL